MFTTRAADTQHIHATPWQIWRVLSRFEGYGGWNPLLTHVSGKAQEGAELELKIRVWGKKPLPYQGKITRIKTYQGLALQAHLAGVPFVLDISLAAFIDPLDKASCKCTLGLRAQGALVLLVEPLLERQLPSGLNRMNLMIKALAEGQTPDA